MHQVFHQPGEKLTCLDLKMSASVGRPFHQAVQIIGHVLALKGSSRVPFQEVHYD